MAMHKFQSTRPWGARLLPSDTVTQFIQFQSTRPWGRDQSEIKRFDDEGISIHAPAGGATGTYLMPSIITSCFNPRARGGRDIWRLTRWRRVTGFNPRARGGRDGRTSAEPDRYPRFNTPARGGHDVKPSITITYNWFQSTSPRGARHPTSCSMVS